MSHQTVIRVVGQTRQKQSQTEFVSIEHLRKALAEVGCTVEERGKVLVARQGRLSIEFTLGVNGRFVAVTREGAVDQFDVAWMGRLTQRYAYQVAKEQLGEQGFEMVEETVGPKQELRLTLRRAA